MAQNKPTTNEHYIPQFYLKQFSPNPIDKNKETIYQFDVLLGKQTPVLIKSICYEKNLYEFKNDSGDYVHRNLIEKVFSVIEGESSNIFRSIQSKTKSEGNFYTHSFLSKKEKAVLIFFLSTMILRNPDVLQTMKDFVAEYASEKASETSIRNFTLQTCLPIYKTLDPNERNILNGFMNLLSDMSFQIGVTNKEALWTSDRPVVLLSYNQPDCIDELIFPMSPSISLYMKPYEKSKKDRYNRLSILRKEDIQYANSAIVKHCKRWIYSKSPLTEKQIEWIKRERNEK